MTYKKLSEATLVESVAEETNVLVEENDEIKRYPMSKMGMSAGGGCNTVIFLNDYPNNKPECNKTFEELKTMITNKELFSITVIDVDVNNHLYFDNNIERLTVENDEITFFCFSQGYFVRYNAESLGIHYTE